ncbi:MAG TPA: pitrilysin family protein [Gemmatimonadaceae bacterium]|nr:pitrilysin family protein [Gemmatimonadaceae bacterium]
MPTIARMPNVIARRAALGALLLVTSAGPLAAQGAAPAPPQAPAQRQAPPTPGAPKNFRVPARRTFDLPNGMRVTLVPYGRVPKVAIELAVRTGVIDEGAQDVSLSRVTTDMLLEGTTTRTPQDISREAAEMGGAVSADGGAEMVTVGGEVLSEFAPRFVALVADVVRNPRFEAADLKRTLDKHARDNAMALAQPGTLAQKRFREIAYGNHPFARLFPDEAMLRAFTVERVKAFHQRNFGAKRAHLYVSGIFDAKAVERAVRDAFTNWPAGNAATENPPTPVAKRQLDLIDRPGSVQSSMWVGLPVANPTSPDWTAMQVTDALLGGAFGSRITSNIREDKGYTYSPFSFIWTRKGSGLWVEVADVTTKDTGPALTEIFKEMQRLGAEAPPKGELDGIKNNLAGVFTIQNSSRSGLVSQLQYADLHQLGDDYLSTYVKKVMAVTPEEVRTAAQQHLDPAKVSVAIVGDKKVVEPQLGQFKPIVP